MDQHASGDHEHQGKGHLRGDEDILEPAGSNRRGTGSGSGRERGAGALNGRGETEQSTGPQRNGEHVGKDLKVGSDVENERAIAGGKGIGGPGHSHFQQRQGEEKRGAAA